MSFGGKTPPEKQAEAGRIQNFCEAHFPPHCLWLWNMSIILKLKSYLSPLIMCVSNACRFQACLNPVFFLFCFVFPHHEQENSQHSFISSSYFSFPLIISLFIFSVLRQARRRVTSSLGFGALMWRRENCWPWDVAFHYHHVCVTPSAFNDKAH